MSLILSAIGGLLGSGSDSGGLISGLLNLGGGIRDTIKQSAMQNKLEDNIDAANMQKERSIKEIKANKVNYKEGIADVVNPYTLALGGEVVNTSQTDSLTTYDSGGTHFENPHGGVPIGKSKEGMPNSVEEGEASFDFDGGKYIFSNRLIV